MHVDFDGRSLMIDGARKFIFSGAIHYYRLPGPDMWRSRLRRLKEMGMNAADIYFYWSYHSPAQGEYDFTGIRDVDLLMDMIEEEGLYLIARPGPYICSEVDGGGLPAWLINRQNLALRCRRNGRFEYDAEYMQYVREWFEKIVPKIAERRNLILFQVENEYHFMPTPRGILAGALKFLQASFGPGFLMNLAGNPFVKEMLLARQRSAFRSEDYKRPNRYIKELYAMVKDMGVKVPVFHNDVVEAGVRFTDVDMLAIDDYPVKSFDRDWRQGGNPFANIDIFEEGHKAHGVECPLFVAETQGGWFDLWEGKGYEYIRRLLGPDSLDITMKSCLAQGASLINLFMACGGTSFGYLASPDVYTSYDMAAPVTEGNRLTVRAKAAKAFADFVSRHEQDILASRPSSSFGIKDRKLFCRSRQSESGKTFLYVRNLTASERTASLEPGANEVSLPPASMAVIVLDDKGGIIDQCEPFPNIRDEELPRRDFPALSDWTFAMAGREILPDYDDSNWIEMLAANRMDMDALGLHFGYAWYRARLDKIPSNIRLHARHCFAVYLNGRLLLAKDNHVNRLANGSDFAETVDIVPEPGIWRKDGNVLVVLVESLGHNKGFLEDLRNPRGLVSLDTQGAAKNIRVRGGLLPGERGMTPRLDFQTLELETLPVDIPHKWDFDAQGVGLYQAKFSLDLEGPDQPPVGLRIKGAHEKANIYLNGYMVGRYWESAGPQKLFYLPSAWLNHKGENHLALAVWRWGRDSGLDDARLEVYP